MHICEKYIIFAAVYDKNQILFFVPALRAENIGVPSECEDVMLQAGELKIFTGKKVELPVINKDLESLLPVENVSGDETQKAQKIMRNGQVLILRGNKMYTITGMEVR